MAIHVDKAGSLEPLKPTLVGLANMAITFLPSNYKFLNVVSATREVVAGVRYNLLVNASDDTGSNQICSIVVMEKPWLLTEWGDKQRKLDYTNCTSLEYNAADRNTEQNFNFNPVFVNQGQGVSDDLMKYLESQILQPKERTTKKPLPIDNYILPVLQKVTTEKPTPQPVKINDPSKSFLDTFFQVDDSVVVDTPSKTKNGNSLANVQPDKEVIRVKQVEMSDVATISSGDFAIETSEVSCDGFSENLLTTTELITETPIDLLNVPNANSENNESNDIQFVNEAIVSVQTPIVSGPVGQDVNDGMESFQEAYRIIEQAVHDNINSEMNYSPQMLPQFVENDESLLQYVNSELQAPEHQVLSDTNSELDASPLTVESEFYAPVVEAVALRFDTSEEDTVTTENVDMVTVTEQQAVSSSERSSVVSSEQSSKSSSSSEDKSREQLVRTKRSTNNEKEYISNLAAQAVDQLDHVDSDNYKRIVLDVINAKRIEKIDQIIYVLKLRVGNSNCAEASTDLQACLTDLLEGSTKLCNLEVNAQLY